jgi:hypothetical protein
MSNARFRIPKFVQAIYNHNPFYLLSACLFVYGLKVYFGTSSGATFTPGEEGYIDPWNLMLALCGVTAVMAVTAFLIVRFGKVWEDARSIVLVLLLMFLAISVSFDEILNRAAWDAINLLFFGLLFSITVVELLVRGLQIRFAWSYRLPFYLFLGLFFAFPAWASPEMSSELRDVVRWRVAMFPCFAGLITLTLIPAVRKGSMACYNNGTPWNWPMFPWSIFAFLLIGVCFRSWTLSISLDTGSMKTSIQSMDSAFGPYFLIPFLLPVICVVLEIAIVERIKKLQNAMMVCGGVLVLMAIPGLTPNGHHVTYLSFLKEVTSAVASPLFLALIAVSLFFAYAWARNVRSAGVGFLACCFGCIFIGPGTVSRATLEFQLWPMYVFGPLLVVLGVIRKQSLIALGGAALLAIAAGWQGTASVLPQFRVLAASHIVLLAVLIMALFFDGAEVKTYCRILAGIVPIMAFVTWAQTMRVEEIRLSVDHVRFWYLFFLASLCLIYAYLSREEIFWQLGFVNLGLLAVYMIWQGYHVAKQVTIPAGVQPLIYGGACFALAIFISLLKGGVFNRYFSHPTTENSLSSDGD